MDAEEKLINTLKGLCPIVLLQGSLLPSEPYPTEFFTFWNNSSDSENYYDNKENAISYNYSVNFYSTEPERTYSIIRDAKKILCENGFIVSGDGYSVLSDEQSHTGRGINVKYRKYVGGI